MMGSDANLQDASRLPSTTPQQTGSVPAVARKLSSKSEDVRRRKQERHEVLLQFERGHWAEARVVAGLDEAGAGPLAGPVTAACVVLNPQRLDELVGVDDSKSLSHARREAHAEVIRASVLAYAVAEASVGEIDRINIRQAGLLAMRRALDLVLKQVDPIHHLLVDARLVPGTSIPQSDLIKGDARSLSIAAASILAKVDRDAKMCAAAELYPEYGFDKHKGYGTAQHLDALRAHGITPLHRRTFEPIKSMLTQLRARDTTS